MAVRTAGGHGHDAAAVVVVVRERRSLAERRMLLVANLRGPDQVCRPSHLLAVSSCVLHKADQAQGKSAIANQHAPVRWAQYDSHIRERSLTLCSA